MKTLLQSLLVILTIWGCNSSPNQKPKEGLTLLRQGLPLTKVDSVRLDSMGRAYNTLGGMDFDKGDYEKALKNYLLALATYEEINNLGRVAAVKINLGNISFGSKNYERALNYYTEAKEIVLNLLKDTADALANKRRLSALYNNIGLVYKNEGMFEKAFDNYLKSMKLMEEIGDTVETAEVCNNLGNMLERNGQYKEALDYYRKSFGFYSKIGNKNGMATVLANIADIRAKRGEYESALENFDKALAMAKEVGDKRVEMEIYKRKARVNAELGNESAYADQVMYSDLLDSINGKESQKQIAQMQVQFETEKKDKENVILKKDKDLLSKDNALKEEQNVKQKLGLWFAVVIVVIVVIFLIFVTRAYKRKRKDNELLARQKKEIEGQKAKIEEHEKAITDSITYAKLIQEAILPPINEIQTVFPNSFVLYKPKDIVSGDFYWFHSERDIALIAAADCTGHGVPGAFMSMSCFGALNEGVKSTFHPSKILDLVNKTIKKSLRQSGEAGTTRDGMDIALCSLLKEKIGTTILRYAGANRPLWIVRHGTQELLEIKADKTAIGGFTKDEYEFKMHEVILNPGDTFYVFSDGFQDQFGGPEGKKFMTKRLRETILEIQNLNMERQGAFLSEVIEKWKKPSDTLAYEQMDDVMVIGIRI